MDPFGNDVFVAHHVDTNAINENNKDVIVQSLSLQMLLKK